MTRGDWLSVLAIIVVAIGGLIAYYATLVKNEEKNLLTTKTGSLDSPQVDPTKPFTVQAGGLIFEVPFDQVRDGFNPRNYVDLGFDYPFNISIKNNQLFVSIEIKNEKNETVAVIQNNQWTVNIDPLIARDRNYNNYAFEVIDSKLIPRVQVILKPENMIYIGGYFSTPVGNILMMPGTTITQPSPEMLKQDLVPIFLYPSAENFGKMNPDVILK